MIKTTELRIGNWILPQHDLDGKYHLVKKLEDKVINDYVEEWYSPIPLTPKILERSGFEFNKVFKYYHKGGIKIFYDDSDAPGIAGDFRFEFNNKLILIEYLHNLQNLYFYLTGEELEIKELQLKELTEK